MAIRKRVGSALFVASAAALAIGLGATSALASTTLTVRVRNGGSYTARATKTVLTDNGVSVTCTSTSTTKASTAKGSIPNGTHTGTSPVKVGTVTSLNFRNCTGPLGPVRTTVQDLAYAVRVDSKTNGSGQTDGMITGIHVKVSMTGCSFVVTGRAPGFYTNSKHTLRMSPKLPIKPLNSARLTVKNVSGCAGLVKDGNHPTYKSTYTLNRSIKIHSS